MQVSSQDGKTFTLKVEREEDHALVDALFLDNHVHVAPDGRVLSERDAKGGRSLIGISLCVDPQSPRALRDKAASQALSALGQLLNLGLREAADDGLVFGTPIDPEFQKKLSADLKQLKVVADTLALAVRQLQFQRGVGSHDSLQSGEEAHSTGAPPVLTPPPIGQYWPGQGGIYRGPRPAFGDMPALHMVTSEDQSEPLPWGVYGKRIPGADSTHDGRANTEALIAAAAENDGSPAATWARNYTKDGYTDFHLPSQADLFLMHAHDRAAGKNSKELLWSSTQFSAGRAFAQHFEDGNSFWYLKDYRFRVRALRLIQL
jgi:hypothetical protein